MLCLVSFRKKFITGLRYLLNLVYHLFIVNYKGLRISHSPERLIYINPMIPFTALKRYSGVVLQNMRKTFVAFYTSSGFLGTITAFGSGGGVSFPHIRAGPGTVYINDNILMGGSSKHTLLVSGDLVDGSQEQTYVQVTGSGANDFDYDVVNITGK